MRRDHTKQIAAAHAQIADAHAERDAVVASQATKIQEAEERCVRRSAVRLNDTARVVPRPAGLVPWLTGLLPCCRHASEQDQLTQKLRELERRTREKVRIFTEELRASER